MLSRVLGISSQSKLKPRRKIKEIVKSALMRNTLVKRPVVFTWVLFSSLLLWNLLVIKFTICSFKERLGLVAKCQPVHFE